MKSIERINKSYSKFDLIYDLKKYFDRIIVSPIFAYVALGTIKKTSGYVDYLFRRGYCCFYLVNIENMNICHLTGKEKVKSLNPHAVFIKNNKVRKMIKSGRFCIEMYKH